MTLIGRVKLNLLTKINNLLHSLCKLGTNHILMVRHEKFITVHAVNTLAEFGLRFFGRCNVSI